MFATNLPDPELLKTLLEPLLEDFQYWLTQAEGLLVKKDIAFPEAESDSDLLERVEQALREVQAAQSLFRATDSQVGVDTAVIMRWHKLTTECWQAASRFREGDSRGPEFL
jgi:broad specificity phosphatase PhoE